MKLSVMIQNGPPQKVNEIYSIIFFKFYKVGVNLRHTQNVQEQKMMYIRVITSNSSIFTVIVLFYFFVFMFLFECYGWLIFRPQLENC